MLSLQFSTLITSLILALWRYRNRFKVNHKSINNENLKTKKELYINYTSEKIFIQIKSEDFIIILYNCIVLIDIKIAYKILILPFLKIDAILLSRIKDLQKRRKRKDNYNKRYNNRQKTNKGLLYEKKGFTAVEGKNH